MIIRIYFTLMSSLLTYTVDPSTSWEGTAYNPLNHTPAILSKKVRQDSHREDIHACIHSINYIILCTLHYMHTYIHIPMIFPFFGATFCCWNPGESPLFIAFCTFLHPFWLMNPAGSTFWGLQLLLGFEFFGPWKKPVKNEGFLPPWSAVGPPFTSVYDS